MNEPIEEMENLYKLIIFSGYIVGVVLLIRPHFLRRILFKNLKLQLKIFKNTHLEKYSIYNLKYAEETTEIQIFLLRLLGIVLILHIFSLLIK